MCNHYSEIEPKKDFLHLGEFLISNIIKKYIIAFQFTPSHLILLFKIRIPKVQNEGFLLNYGTHSLIMEVCTVGDTSKTHVQAYLPYFCERAPTKQCRHTHQKIASTSLFTSRHEGLGMPCSDLLCALWVVAFSCHNSIRTNSFCLNQRIISLA